ncbi:MAG: restriction endonuclease [Chloroflexi bacterium]|nr:restriction endonuclease [Chloroflexota bacterium]
MVVDIASGENYRQIHFQLERAIAEKQRELQATIAERNAAARLEAKRRSALESINSQLAGVDLYPYDAYEGVYLDGKALDRGLLELDGGIIRFSGWRGMTEIPLQDVKAIQVGTSKLHRYAGTFLLDQLLPGEGLPAESILLFIQGSADATPRLAVIASLQDAGLLYEKMRQYQLNIETVTAHRTELLFQREGILATISRTQDALQRSQSRITSLQAEIDRLRHRQESLQSQHRSLSDLYQNSVAITQFLESLTGFEVMGLTEKLFRTLGYQVTRIEDSAEEGLNLELIKHGRLAAVQCDPWNGAIGSNVVSSLYGAMKHIGASEGHLVTLGNISLSARDWAVGKPISFIQKAQIVYLVQQYKLLT